MMSFIILSRPNILFLNLCLADLLCTLFSIAGRKESRLQSVLTVRVVCNNIGIDQTNINMATISQILTPYGPTI